MVCYWHFSTGDMHCPPIPITIQTVLAKHYVSVKCTNTQFSPLQKYVFFLVPFILSVFSENGQIPALLQSKFNITDPTVCYMCFPHIHNHNSIALVM